MTLINTALRTYAMSDFCTITSSCTNAIYFTRKNDDSACFCVLKSFTLVMIYFYWLFYDIFRLTSAREILLNSYPLGYFIHSFIDRWCLRQIFESAQVQIPAQKRFRQAFGGVNIIFTTTSGRMHTIALYFADEAILFFDIGGFSAAPAAGQYRPSRVTFSLAFAKRLRRDTSRRQHSNMPYARRELNLLRFAAAAAWHLSASFHDNRQIRLGDLFSDASWSPTWAASTAWRYILA